MPWHLILITRRMIIIKTKKKQTAKIVFSLIDLDREFYIPAFTKLSVSNSYFTGKIPEKRFLKKDL